MSPDLVETLRARTEALHLRNALSYPPLRRMSPIALMDFLAARGHGDEFIDKAMVRILSAKPAKPRRRRKSLRELVGG